MATYPGAPTGSVRSTPQGRELTIQRAYSARIEEVWASFTEPQSVARWYGVIDGSRSPGSTITITMTAEEGDPAEQARVLECDPPRKFVIETAGMGQPWRLQLELEEAGGQTRMTFTHRLSDDLDAADIGPGWEFYADRHHAAFNNNTMPDWSDDDYPATLGPHYDSN